MTLRVAIADNDRTARKRLRQLLEAEPDILVARELRSGWETVRAVRAEKPDVLFLAVQMPDLDGFAVLEEIRPKGIPAVVFVTAFDQYAVKAFEVGASDYLLKPLDPRRLHKTLELVRRRVETRRDAGTDARRIGAFADEGGQRFLGQRLSVPAGDRILFLPTEGVLAVEAAGNYVRIHTDGGTYLRRDTLANMAELLDPEQFFRVHRSWLVNVARIQELIPWLHRTFILVMENGHRIQASRPYRDRIKSLLGKRPRQKTA